MCLFSSFSLSHSFTFFSFLLFLYFLLSFSPSFRAFLENVDHEVKPSIFRAQSLETKGEERKIVVPPVVACFLFIFGCCFCCLLVVLLYCGFVVMLWLFGQQQRKTTPKDNTIFYRKFCLFVGLLLSFVLVFFVLLDSCFCFDCCYSCCRCPRTPQEKTAN